MWQPAYVETWESGKLAAVAAGLSEHYSECSLCPRRCGADRKSGDVGVCGAGWKMKVSSAHAHFGEESPLVGRFGSGTIFFSHCSLRCVYCQNWQLSHGGEGTEVTDRELADMMLALEQRGCHNINFVTPSHYLPGILAALVLAAADGLRLPIVYNCGGYDCRFCSCL